MADTVIAPDLRERHEEIGRFIAEHDYSEHEQEIYHLIERVSKAEQENVALRAEREQLKADNLRLKNWIAEVLDERNQLQRAAGFLEQSAKSYCAGALVVLARNHFCTPEETYGRNTSWAISDLCLALDALRAKVAKLEAPVSNEEWHPMISYEANDTGFASRENVDALIAARGREGE